MKKGWHYYFIRTDNKKAGALRVLQKEDNCRLSSIYILPEYQKRGYAQLAISKVEGLYPQVKHWTLETIKQEPKLCSLYEKMGYCQSGEEKPIKEGMILISYEKFL